MHLFAYQLYLIKWVKNLKMKLCCQIVLITYLYLGVLSKE